MSRATMIVLTLLCCSPGLGCGEDEVPCAGEGIIEPGVGVGAGGQAICLGEGAAALEARLGMATRSQDLGALGRRVEYDKLKVTLLLGGTSGALSLKAMYIGSGSTLKTAGGVGLGSSEAEIKAALGEPVKDPFLGAWWYPKKGITLQMEAGKVVAIQLTAAASK